MGDIASSVGGLFGIGPKEGNHYSVENSRARAYYDFVNKQDPATNGITGSRMAADEIRNGDLTKGLYGEGGLQDRLGTEEKDLAARGYSLQPQDHEAYGQASGNIARQFGQQEQDVSKSLNRRGLGGTSSGAAGAAFSGLAGNKNEMLAKAQTDIAQKRMADTQQRLQSTRNMMGSLGQQAQGAQDAQFGRQLAGRQLQGNELGKAAQVEDAVNNQEQASVASRNGAKNKNIGDAWSEGTYSGVKSGTADSTSSWMSMGGSGAMGMSDEDNKTGIKGGSGRVREFLDQAGGSGASGGFQPSAGAPSGRNQGAMEDSGGGEKKGGGPMDMLGGLMGGGFSGGGGCGGGMGVMMSMFSDENCKTDVQNGDQEIRGFLDSVEPHSYEYKDEYKNGLGGPGEYVSPMAQELEQTDLGADMVQDTPDGKIVDYGKGFGTLLAGMADVNKRLSAIEGRK